MTLAPVVPMQGNDLHPRRADAGMLAARVRPRVDVLEDEPMKPLKVAEIVRACQPTLGKLRESQRARLRLSLSQQARVFQPGQVAQDIGAKVDVRVSHCAGGPCRQCRVDTGATWSTRYATDSPAARRRAASPSCSVSSAELAHRSRISRVTGPGSKPSARTDPMASATIFARESIKTTSRIPSGAAQSGSPGAANAGQQLRRRSALSWRRSRTRVGHCGNRRHMAHRMLSQRSDRQRRVHADVRRHR